MDTSRPSVMIYLRRDQDQLWRETDSDYEMGYLCGMADKAAGLDPLPCREFSAMAGEDGGDGYYHGYWD